MWGTPLDIKEWELDLNVHISLKLGMISRKNSGASCWKYPKYKPWKLSTKRSISPELDPWNDIFIHFPWSSGLKPFGGRLEYYFSTPSQNHLKSSLNRAQILQFWLNRVGDPFGPRGVGAKLQCVHFAEAWNDFVQKLGSFVLEIPQTQTLDALHWRNHSLVLDIRSLL